MKKSLSTFTALLPIWVIIIGVWAFYRPGDFEWTQYSLRFFLGGFLSETPLEKSQSIFAIWDQAIFNWLFAFTMFSVGTVIDPKSFKILATHPKAVLLGLLTQFSVMPLLAFGLTKTFQFHPDIALGFIVVGCAPGAMTSNVLTYLAKGDAAYSVTLTSFASVIAVFLTPILVVTLAGATIQLDLLPQIWKLAWTVAIPLLAGLSLRVLYPKGKEFFEQASPVVAVISIVLICAFVVQWTHSHLKETTFIIAFGVVIVNALGFILGGLLGGLYGLTTQQKITLSIEVGMQNAGMGVVLAVGAFEDKEGVAVPAALFALWCIITGAVLIEILKRRRAKESASRS